VETELEFGTHPTNTAPKTKIAAAYLEVLKEKEQLDLQKGQIKLIFFTAK